jgi:copper chaperone CopZ
MTKVALLAVATLGFASLSAQAEEKKATFKVNGMMCGSCENAVKGAVTKVEGVKSIDADSGAGTATVAYDPAKTDEGKIAAAINTTKFKVQK